ncbi:MAG: formate dehydrogenase accessory protein FdhE [bacterium]
MTAWEKELSDLEKLERISKEQAEFYRRLGKIQAEYRKRLEKEKLFQVPKGNLTKIKKGLPLVRFSKVKIDETCLASIFKDVSQLFDGFNSKRTEELNIKELIEKVIKIQNTESRIQNEEKDYLERVSDKLKIDKDLLFFVCINTAVPIFETIARKLKPKIDEKLWFRNYCPVCGGKPLIARLKKEDGKRVLQCAICNTEWQFQRIKCVWCGTEDPKDLRFFWADEGSCRVDVCDKCKGYIKTLDERKLLDDKEVIPQIEDIATTYLNILAEKEGYNRTS